MHLAGADLDLQRPALGPDHRRVQRLVHVELRHRDEVLEAPRQRLPQRVDHADRAVAVLDRADDHAHRGQVVDLVELAALLGHLRVDRVEVLGAAGDLGLDPELVELLGQVLAGLVDVALALGALLGDQALDLVVLARVQRLEGEVLELPLDRVDAEPVGDRRVDVERLARLLDLLLLRHRGDRAHVVQAVGELDQDDPDVRGHRDHHLAVVLGLRLVARLEGQPGELGDAVDQAGDLLAERLAGPPPATPRCPRRCRAAAPRTASRCRAACRRRSSPRRPGWMMKSSPDCAPLVGVVHAGVDERLLDARRGRSATAAWSACSSTIANRSPSSRRSTSVSSARSTASGRRRRRPGRPAGAASRSAADGRRRHRPAARPPPSTSGRASSAAAADRAAASEPAQPLGRGFALLRNRRPSSYRVA